MANLLLLPVDHLLLDGSADRLLVALTIASNCGILFEDGDPLLTEENLQLQLEDCGVTAPTSTPGGSWQRRGPHGHDRDHLLLEDEELLVLV